MKIILKRTMIALFAVLATSFHCCPKCDEEIMLLEDKFYLEKSQIHFADNELYIEAEGALYWSPALYCDEEGYYITTIAKKKSCSWYEWRCSKCHLCNVKGLDWKCRQCGKSIEK